MNYIIIFLTIAIQYYADFCNAKNPLKPLAKSTMRRFRALIKHVNEFNPKQLLEFCDNRFLFRFHGFLTIKKKMNQSTVNTYMNILVAVLKWTYNKGYHNQKAFQSFKSLKSKIQPNDNFLTIEELNKLISFRFEPCDQFLIVVRDIFCCMCLTGLPLNLIYSLRKSTSCGMSFEGQIHGMFSHNLNLENAPDFMFRYSYLKKGEYLLPSCYQPYINDLFHRMGEIVGINRKVNRYIRQGNKTITINQPLFEILGSQVAKQTFKKHQFGNRYCNKRTDNFLFQKIYTLKNL